MSECTASLVFHHGKGGAGFQGTLSTLPVFNYVSVVITYINAIYACTLAQ